MKTIAPYRTTVTTFSTSSAAQQQPWQQQGFEYDSGQYILSVASPAPSPSHSDASSPPCTPSSCAAAALSDHSVVLYDAIAGRVTRRIDKAHDGTISEIHFFPPEHPHGSPLVISAGHDGTAKVWDARAPGDRPAVSMRLATPSEQALTVSLGYGGTLAAVGTSGARVSFFDLRCNNGSDNRPGGSLLGSYVDAHTEEVTRVRFQSVPRSPQASEATTVLATASEDGLVAIHDPARPSEDAALISVLNIGAPLRDVGFFGSCLEGIYALTGSETMSVHHWESAQKVSDLGGMELRGLLSNALDAPAGRQCDENGMDDDSKNRVEYLVGCTWDRMSPEESPALHLLAGNSEGDGYLFRMDADQITPLSHLKGGHRGCIRDFCLVDNLGGGKRFITGGEGARLCEWDLTGNENNASFSNQQSPTTHRIGSRPMGGRLMKYTSGNNSGAKGRRKTGSPY